MDPSLLFFHLGSYLLGMTSAIALLFRLARHSRTDGAESCLGVVICCSGIGLALLSYAVGLQLLT